MTHFDSDGEFALALDAADELAEFSGHFDKPRDRAGAPVRYLCGHSLGLMPAATRAGIKRELDRWSSKAVGGHFDADGWFDFHQRFAAPLARLLGADTAEVVAMNALTVNLHLMLVSFFTPQAERCRILIERDAFPSDRFAVQSQLAFHGLDPQADLIEFVPAAAGRLTAEALDAALTAEAGRVALVLLPGVQYRSGEAIDLPACAEVVRRHGARLGLDLAHAIGNLALDLRAAEPDFAVWCSYKYLNGGPGAIGGCFVNRRWLGQAGLLRFAGWWGHDPESRFAPPGVFQPPASADGWQLSNPPILAMVPLAASLELFDAAGIGRLRAKSMALTAYLESLLNDWCGEQLELLSPREPDGRGAQLSLRVPGDAARMESLVAALDAAGIIVDWRAPDVLRLAPVPLYNSFADVHAAVAALASELSR